MLDKIIQSKQETDYCMIYSCSCWNPNKQLLPDKYRLQSNTYKLSEKTYSVESKYEISCVFIRTLREVFLKQK